MTNKFIAVNTIILLAFMDTNMCPQVNMIIICFLCWIIETDQRRNLAKSVDELNNQLEHQTTTLHSQIVAAQS